MNIKNVIFLIIIGGLVLLSLFFFDANPTLWVDIFLSFYFFEKGTELYKEKKYLKAAVMYFLSLVTLILVTWFIYPHLVYLFVFISLGYIPYYLYKNYSIPQL